MQGILTLNKEERESIGFSDEDVQKIILSEVVSLFLASEQHKRWAISELEHLVLPLIKLGQYGLVLNKNRTIGFASWAYFNRESEEAFVTRCRRLKASDWNSGRRCWWVDLLAPYGGLTPITAQVREFCPFPTALFLRQSKHNDSLRVCEWLKKDRTVRKLASISGSVENRKSIYNSMVEPVLRYHEEV